MASEEDSARSFERLLHSFESAEDDELGAEAVVEQLWTVAVPIRVVPSRMVTVEPASATSTVPVIVCAAELVERPALVIVTVGAVVMVAVSETLSRSHWLGSLRAENSNVDELPVAVTL